MARSENQGLQIALILFVLLTVALAIATFGFFQSADKAEKEATQAKADAATANQAVSKAVADMRQLNLIIGVAEGDDLQVVQEAARIDLDLYNSTFGTSRQDYRSALTELIGILATANQERQQERTELDALKQRVDAIEAAKDAALKALRDEVAKQTTLRNDREKALADTDTTHNATRLRLDAQIKAANDQLAQITKEADDKVKAMEAEVAKVKLDLIAVRDNFKKVTSQAFDGADGEVQWVSPRAGTVWINLGRADGLAKQMSFSVWGRDENDFVNASPKGMIEVSQLLDEHLAEAKIIEDSLSEPIMPGDRIANPAWDPGLKQAFAVAGVVDFNGDGQDDMETFRSLVALHGGTIVAEMDAEGNIVGPGIDIHTRYLVLGGSPEAAEQTAAVDSYSKLVKAADDAGVEVIDLNKFLSVMGWKDPNRVLTFGAGGNAQEFLDPNEERRQSTGTTSGLFRKRRPASNGNSSF